MLSGCRMFSLDPNKDLQDPCSPTSSSKESTWVAIVRITCRSSFRVSDNSAQLNHMPFYSSVAVLNWIGSIRDIAVHPFSYITAIYSCKWLYKIDRSSLSWGQLDEHIFSSGWNRRDSATLNFAYSVMPFDNCTQQFFHTLEYCSTLVTVNSSSDLVFWNHDLYG